jgi:exodeoxyribonuclease-3
MPKTTLRLFHPNEPNLFTWWSHFGHARENNVGWRIDYFLASPGLRDRITGAAIHPGYLGSDHCPISVTLK